jgi:DnaJ like chaperone protein
VLEVAPHATQSEIKSAYHRKLQKYHPDRVSGLGDELQSLALKKSQEITAAYQEAIRNS